MKPILVIFSLLFVISCGGDGDSSASNTNANAPLFPLDITFSPIALSDRATQTMVIKWQVKQGSTVWDAVSLCQDSNSDANNCQLIKKVQTRESMISLSLNKDNIGIIPLISSELFLIFHKGEQVSNRFDIRMPKEVIDETVQFFKSSSPSEGAEFGISVDISAKGKLMVIGATSRLVDGKALGGVYTFVDDGDGWLQASKVIDSATEHSRFGHRVALSDDGEILVVSVSNDAPSATGSIRIYQKTGVGIATTWVEKDKLQYLAPGDTKPMSSALLGLSGFDISADASVIAASLYLRVQQNTEQRIAIFTRDDSEAWQWSQVTTQGAGAVSTTADHGIGNSISISDDGAYIAVGEAQAGSGLVHIFSGKDFTTFTTLKPNTPTEVELFGLSVSLSNMQSKLRLAVGTSDEVEDNSSAVYLFEREPSGKSDWRQVNKITAPSETSPQGNFGRYVKLSNDGNTLAVMVKSSFHMPGVNHSPSPASKSSSNGLVVLYQLDDAAKAQPILWLQNKVPVRETSYGEPIAFSAAGGELVIGGYYEKSSSAGINGTENNNGAKPTGSVWLYKLGATP